LTIFEVDEDTPFVAWNKYGRIVILADSLQKEFVRDIYWDINRNQEQEHLSQQICYAPINFVIKDMKNILLRNLFTQFKAELFNLKSNFKFTLDELCVPNEIRNKIKNFKDNSEKHVSKSILDFHTAPLQDPQTEPTKFSPNENSKQHLSPSNSELSTTSTGASSTDVRKPDKIQENSEFENFFKPESGKNLFLDYQEYFDNSLITSEQNLSDLGHNPKYLPQK
jgi:hypothetical protein